MAAAVVPLSSQQENEAAPVPQPASDPSARLDSAALTKNQLTTAQRQAAMARENKLRSVLGLAYSDLATAEALNRDYASALTTTKKQSNGTHPFQGWQRTWDRRIPSRRLWGCNQRTFQGACPNRRIRADSRRMLGMSYFATDKYADAAKTFAPLGTRGMQDGESATPGPLLWRTRAN